MEELHICHKYLLGHEVELILVVRGEGYSFSEQHVCLSSHHVIDLLTDHHINESAQTCM